MPGAYTPILIFAILAGAFPVIAVAVYRRLHPAGPASEAAAGQSGVAIDFEPTAPREYASRFYAIAALAVILSVALVFLFVWAILFAEMGGYGLVSMLIFVGILLAGYVWLYRQGAFDWT
jgi:NADH-quinone oxidoreductase subunit A